jgi:type I restriction enzyme S subunit
MEKLKNVPVLRFPEFKGEWEKKKLGDVTKISSGGTPSRNNSAYWGGNIPWVSTTLIDFTTIYKSEEYITKEGLKNSSAKVYPVGTLLMAIYGQGKTRGKVALLGIEATTNQACLAIIPDKEKLKEVFLFQNLAGRYNEIRNLSNQGGQENLSGELIKNVFIIFPTLEEQYKIGSLQTAIDDKIQALKKKKTLLEQYKKGVMQKIFSQELRFKDDNWKEFPKWGYKPINKLDIYISDGNYGEKYPKSSEMKSIGIPFIRANNIKDLKLVWDDMRFIDKELHSCLTSGHLRTNDILITTRGEIGMLAIVTDEFDGSNINAQICLLRTSHGLNSFYLLQYLSSNYGKKQFKELQTGTALKQLPRNNLGKLKIKLPSIEEQTKIASFLSSIDEKINLCSTQIEKTEQYKKGLLQKMFV